MSKKKKIKTKHDIVRAEQAHKRKAEKIAAQKRKDKKKQNNYFFGFYYMLNCSNCYSRHFNWTNV